MFVPRVILCSWDLVEKLGIVKSIHNAEKYIFALLIGIMTILMKYYRNSVPSGYQSFYNAIFGEIK